MTIPSTSNNAINALLSGPAWTSTPGTAVTVTYSFMAYTPSDLTAADRTGLTQMTAAQKAQVIAALATWSAVANITFVQVADSGANSGGMIRFAQNDQGTTSAAYTDPWNIGGNLDHAYVFVNNDTSYNNSGRYLSNYDFTAGSYADMTLVHEIGHALGFKHPGNYNAGGGGTPGPYLPSSLDNNDYTVMSYNQGTLANNSTSNYVYPNSPALYDIQAMQYIYGANTSYHAGNDTYYFNNNTIPTCIWDAGGINTFDFSACTAQTVINLNAGFFSQTKANANNVSIAFGVTIQNAIAGNGGSSIWGNAANDTLTGGTGNDTFNVGGGTTTITGGGGTDTVVFHNAKSKYTITKAPNGQVTVAEAASQGSDGTAVMTGITTLQFSDTSVATSTLVAGLAVAQFIGASNSGSLGLVTGIADTGSNILANLDNLKSLVLSGALTTITLTDSPPALAVSAQQAGAYAALLHALSSNYSLTVSGTTATIGAFLAKEDVTGRGLNGIGAMYAGSAPAGGDGVTGFQSTGFSQGSNAIVLDNARTSYAIQASNTGTITIKDIGTGDATYGQTVTISGASYLIFNGGASTTVASLPVYTQAYFVESAANAQLAQFYAAATQFKNSIALSGLEYWENQLAGGMSLAAIAQSFLNTGYFQTTYGDPGTTHTQHVSYVQALYQNILGVTLSATNAGVAYWAGQLDSGVLNGATTMISFTNATTNTAAINAVSGTTAGSGSGWLIIPSLTGGYADPTMQQPAATVLAQAATTNFYNLSLIDPASIGASGLTSGGATLASGSLSLGAAAPAATVYLSASFTQVVVNNNGTTVHDGPGSDTITVGGSNDIITLGSATSDRLALANASGAYVFNFTPAKGSVLAVSGTTHPTATTLLNGTTTQVQGSALNFGTDSAASPIFINIGTVGGNSSPEVVAAANAAYKVSDSNGNAVTGVLGEHLTFLGTDSGGNTDIWAFKAASPYATADTAAAHAVTASAITLVATIVGVPAGSLTAADLA